VEEEADETLFWLEIILELGILPGRNVNPLVGEMDQVLAMVVSSIRTAREGGRNVKSAIRNPKSGVRNPKSEMDE
jgi:hypothetical protein